jgi:hypothetical protein
MAAGMTSGNEPERILLVKGRSGLGNRLLALLTGTLFAKLAGRRLVVDWRDPVYSDSGENAFPLLFDRPDDTRSLSEYQSRSVAPAAWQGRLDWTAVRVVEHFGVAGDRWRSAPFRVQPGRLDYDEAVAVYWSPCEQIHEMRRHFRGQFRCLANHSDEAILRELMRSHLPPHPDIAAQVRDFRQRHWNGDVVGVHLRYSDRRGRVSNILRLVDHITSCRPKCQVLLCTDNADLLRHGRERYGASRVLATGKWLPPPGKPIHLTPGAADRLQMAREAMVDLHLLGSADWLITDERSTFAYVARLLFEGPPSQIRNFDPGRFLPRHLGNRLGAFKQILGEQSRKAWRRFRADRGS